MSRVSFDEESAQQQPQHSKHWQTLHHGVDEGEILKDVNALKVAFLRDIKSPEISGENLALWSCVLGYAEALATNKEQRYRIFPIPFGALKRLMKEEFLPLFDDVPTTSNHRSVLRTISNTIWSKAFNKPNSRDEIHANSVYVLLRGSVDKKSMDCFGAALATVAACQIKGLSSSQLTLSEDHAYETHMAADGTFCTCEVAVPGNTKVARARRGREVGDTFTRNRETSLPSLLTPETSWLYMASNPVVCDSIPMTLVAVVGNINCTIDKRKLSSQNGIFASGQLYDLKRELLWILYDQGHMTKFPFGLLELGDCEEHRGSPRSEKWVNVHDIAEPILMNEKLFWDAIRINIHQYNEAQVYPYFYAGHYHKDAGNEGPEHEYRLIHSMKYYADAARVASRYRYEGADSLQLNKHMSSAAMLIAEDILTPKYTQGIREPRNWIRKEHALVAGTWLMGFFDSLLLWEETSGEKHFVEILSPTHKFGIGKLFQLLPQDVRTNALQKVLGKDGAMDDSMELPYFHGTRSSRLSEGSLLVQAFCKPRVFVGEIELAITSQYDGTGRRRKRTRR